MVTADGTDAFVLGKRKRGRGFGRGEGRSRRRQRKQIRRLSYFLVKTGEIPQKPCLICGSQQDLTIHHFEPMRPDRFVFLCQPCHDRAHQPLYRAIAIPVALGQFSIRPEAAIPRKEVCCG